MQASGIRFSAPSTSVPSEVDWLLARALGPPDKSWGGARIRDLDSLTKWIGVEELLSRARVRTRRRVLESELSEDLVIQLDRAVARVVAVEILQEKVSLEVASVASRHRIPLMFLKGMALRLGAYAQPGSRSAGDIDVLVDQESAHDLSQLLSDQGCVVLDLKAQYQHLPPLRHPLGVVIEIHTVLNGVSIHGSRSATASDCLQSGLCDPLGNWPEGIYIPREDLLTAHLIVHGVGQHGFAPDSYPQFQLLADLQDLGFPGDLAEGFPMAGACWIEGEVSREELQALRELLRELELGKRVSNLGNLRTPGARLLRHLMAGAANQEYRQSLKLVDLVQATALRGGLLGSIRGALAAVFLTRGQIDLIYGAPKSWIGYLGRRLWRPMDVAIRLVRSLRARRRIRRTS